MKPRQYLLVAIAVVFIIVGARFKNFWIVGAGAIFAAVSTYKGKSDNDDVFHHPNRLQP